MNFFKRYNGLALLLACTSATSFAQFKEVKPAPFSTAVALQKIRALLQNTDATNRDQAIATISDWLTWYRDIVDEELLARWKSDGRANVPLVMKPLADARVARQIVDYSWRTARPETFTLASAAMLGDLMARYPESAKPVLDDLLPPQPAVELTPDVAEAVCRILIDMPDIGSWRKYALQILPRYRAAADHLLKQDLTQPDKDAVYSAMRWRSDLNLDPPPVSSQRPNRRVMTPPVPSQAAIQPPTLSGSSSQRPHIVGLQPDQPPGYSGPMLGTFESTGGPIPPNGEYVFPNIPPVHLTLDFDTKRWEAHLERGEGQTQVLVLKNIDKKAQKRCVVHWTITP